MTDNEKKLSRMTLEELWQLFPIFLTDHNDDWACWYEDEKSFIFSKLSGATPIIMNHIGSTAINEIKAKSIIDILVECEIEKFDEISKGIQSCGYIIMSESETRRDFNKGYTPDGFSEKVYHLHLRVTGDNDELFFRDYLNEHPDAAKEYERLKLPLWEKYEHDRDAYTEGKSDFVKAVMNTNS